MMPRRTYGTEHLRELAAHHRVWVCYSDQTSHAVMSGQHMLEQTFFLPVAALRHPELAPLSVLERLQGRKLV